MIYRNATILFFAALAACGGSADGDGDGMPEPAAAAEEPVAAPAAEPPAPQFERAPAPEGAAVYIIEPEDGDSVSNPVRVVFGLRGFGVVPAGIQREDAGHHHLLIDADPPSMDAPIPSDDRHRHFGLGQTETELTLPAGEHRLQLLLGDHLHVPHDPPLLSEPITINVTE